ncbi:MAG: hypothetical protein IJT91_02610, partial [Clostridia bacterium]|nr:hypothetical protein [Clostridia bacterium]
MKHCKSLLAIILAVLMIVPAFAFTASAGEKEDTFLANWRLSAMKWQSTGEYKHIQNFVEARYKDNGYVPYYEITEDGGIKCTALTYDQAPGAMSAQCLTTLNKCSLDDLEIKLSFDDFTMNHLVNLSSSIHMLWCTDLIGGDVDGHYSDYYKFCMGQEQAYAIGQNGLRDTIPDNSKALAINICNPADNKQNDLTHIASCVQITYYDGSDEWAKDMPKADGHVGMRWTFMKRSGDAINQAAERIDFTDGLTIKIKRDDTLGYKVVIVDGLGIEHKYYETSKVAYFPPPSASDTKDFIPKDMDFSDLVGLTGYLSVGVNGSDKNDPNVFTLETINGIPAYQFSGHTHTPDGNVVTEQEFPCKEGISYETC